MSSNKKYWKSIEELSENSSVVDALRQNEFVEEIPTDEFLSDSNSMENSSTTRRDFLKYVGFSTAAATLAACEGPVVKSIPYVVQPEEIIPGVANYYATTIADGYDFASVLVKTREGRPIKIENNKEAKSNGSANARVNASVLSLYDSLRLKTPLKNGSVITWSKFNSSIKSELEKLNANGEKVVFLTQTLASPSAYALIEEVESKYENIEFIEYDSVSYATSLDAFKDRYSVRGLANYDFSKSKFILSFGADFLADWQGGGFSSSYTKTRIPDHGQMSRHVQIEANMSLTGANADNRIALTPAQQKLALVKFYGYLTGTSVNVKLDSKVEKEIQSLASEAKKYGSDAVVVAGIDDKDAQALILEINEYLSSKAFDKDNFVTVRKGCSSKFNTFLNELENGSISGVIMSGVNPVYTLADSDKFKASLEKLKLSVLFTSKENETSDYVKFVGAAPHYLESWGDVQLRNSSFALTQPVIRPLFDTKQFEDLMLSLVDSNDSYNDFIKSYWNSNILNGASFNSALHDGFFTTNSEELISNEVSVSNSVSSLSSSKAKGLELTLYSKVGMGDGQQANNPWLQEFPDPISRASWDNYLTVSSVDAENIGFVNENVANGALNGSYANVTVGSTTLKVPVLIQPGQAVGSVGLSIGYGRTKGLKDEMKTGVNAYKFYNDFSSVQSVIIEKAEGTHEFACVQLHNTLMGRGDVVKETSLEIFNTKDKSVWNSVPMVSLDHTETPVTSPEVDLWDEFDRTVGHHFNLSIDLNACTGCGACVIACHAENNVPVVGKAEVRRSRDMHWLRIDRYYSSEDSFALDNDKKENISGLGSSLSEFGEMENPSLNPQVAFQPVMCQHCNHAPCETVCPVAATSHGRQGQNHMAYNRCVGTRYCANNCPYKVRRFNWFLYNNNDEFDYHMNDDLGRMVLNPDVVVRSRGVMEKCSLCIQKTQKTILDAKRDGRVINDGEFQTACSAACDNGAMIFGDINDKDSKVAKLKDGDRMYHLLEHIGTKPNVIYQTKVRNTK